MNEVPSIFFRECVVENSENCPLGQAAEASVSVACSFTDMHEAFVWRGRTILLYREFSHSFCENNPSEETLKGIVKWQAGQTTHPFRSVESGIAGATATRARRSFDIRSSDARLKVSSGGGE